MGWAPGARVWRALFWFGCVANVAALLAGRHLPSTDLAQHTATIATMRDLLLGDPGVTQHFTLALGRTQYVLFYVVGAALAAPLGAEGAVRALLVAVAVTLPLANRALARALGRDERLALLSLPLLFSQAWVIGFLNFLASLPLVLAGLALVVRQAAQPTRRRALWLAAASCGIFFLHLSSFLFFVPAAGVALLLLGGRARWKAPALRFGWLLPAAVLSLTWLAVSPVVHPGDVGFEVPQGISFRAPLESIAALPEALTDVWRTRWDEVLLAAWALVVLVLLAGATVRGPSDDARGARVALWLAALGALLYFAMPYSVGWLFMLDDRYAVLTALVLPLAGRPGASRAGGVALASAAVIALGSAALAFANVRAFQAEAAGIDEALALLPPGAKVLALVPDEASRSAVAKSMPLHHLPALHRARTGGIVELSFLELPQSPVRYRDGHQPPRRPWGWEWHREGLPTAEDAAWFDAIVVGDASGRPVELGPPFTRVGQAGRWWIFVKTAPRSEAD